MIHDDDVRRVREEADIVAVATQHLALKRVGRRMQGLCPFHAEKTPSFSINPDEGLYYCFGCQASGDVITFVREMEHLDFVGAVEFLANRLNVTLRYTDKGEGESRKRRSLLVDAMAKAEAFYHERLLSSDDAAAARGYLRARGYDGEVVRTFRLGWAPDAWDVLCHALGLPDDVLVDTGLGFRNRRNRQQDVFRARIVFPISDVQGDVVAFGGRRLPDGDGPKYKNSSETKLYRKSRVLYGLDRSKAAVVAADEVVVCEGYTDVIGFALAGVDRTVATCGTALTEEHVRTLRRFAGRIVLAFDADAAGQAAAERVYEWEQEHEVEVAVAALPAGVDPGDLARDDPSGLEKAVAEAAPLLDFRIHRVLDGADLTTVERRVRAAERAVEVVHEHPNPLVRDQYLMEIADRCRVDVDRLRTFSAGGGGRPAPAASERPSRRQQVGTLETEVLRLAVHHPAEVADIVDDVLFVDDVHAGALAALQAADSLREAIEAAPGESSELLRRLAVEETPIGEDGVHLGAVKLLVARTAEAVLAELTEADRRDLDAERSAERRWLKLQIEALRTDDSTVDQAGQLLDWLVRRERA